MKVTPYRTKVGRERVSLYSVFVALAIFASPFSSLNIGGRGIYIYIFIPLILLFLYTKLNQSWRYRMTSASKVMFFLLAYYLFGFLWSPSTNVVNTVQVIVLMITVGLTSHNSKEQQLIKVTVVLTLIITTLLVHNSAMGVQEDGRASITIFGVERDPNYVSLFYLPGVAILTNILFGKTKFLWKLLSLLLLLWTVFSTLRMGTRGGLFSIVFILFLSSFSFRKISIRSLLLALVILVIIYYLLPYFLDMLPEWVANRFSKEKLSEDRFGGRLDIWELVANVMSSQNILVLLFGFGSGSSFTILAHATHNFIAQYLIEGGVIALFIVLLFIYRFLKMTYRSRDYLPLIIFAGSYFMALSLSVAVIVDFWINIAVAFALLNPSNKTLY